MWRILAVRLYGYIFKERKKMKQSKWHQELSKASGMVMVYQL